MDCSHRHIDSKLLKIGLKIEAIKREQKVFEHLFERLCAKLRTGAVDQDLARQTEIVDAALRESRDALYRHTQEHLRSLGL